MLSFYEGRIRVYDGIKSAMRRVNTPPNCYLHFMGFVNENWVRFYYQGYHSHHNHSYYHYYATVYYATS